jgi:hypothetical protein
MLLFSTNLVVAEDRHGWSDGEPASFVPMDQHVNMKLERGPAIIREVFSAEYPNARLARASSSGYAGKVLVIVGASLYPRIADSLISMYVPDLQAEGYSVRVFTISGGTSEDVRSLLIANRTDLQGTLMIGDVPPAYFKYFTHDGAGVRDLGYMDLDGAWIDTDSDGVWDVAANGSGNLDAEIWVGWLYPVKMGGIGRQAELVNDYLSRNHHYRTGEIVRLPRAKMFLDGSWAVETHWGVPLIESALGALYPEVSAFRDSSVTGRATYLDSLQSDYEFWFLTTHSGYSKHVLHRQGGILEYVRWADIDSISPKPLFYYLYACGAAAYQLDSCIASYYVLGGTSGLVLVASTVVGGMGFGSIQEYFTNIAQGDNFGSALVKYYSPANIPPPESWGDFNEISMSILGDPSLRPLRQTIVVYPDGSGDAATIQAAIDAAHNGARIVLKAGVYTGVGNRDIDFRGKRVTVVAEDSSALVVIDCQQSGRGFWFGSGETSLSRLVGVTIINGSTPDSGGAILIENGSAPEIIDCLIRDNTSAANGGGVAVYGSGSALIKGCTIVHNQATSGAGIYIDGGAPRTENCIVALNTAGGIKYDGVDSSIVSCSDVFGNSGGDWSGTTNLAQANRNFSLDPKFCDTLANDYRLNNTSPCRASHNECSVLLGSEETGCFDFCGDVDGSGFVNITDAVALLDYIFAGGLPPEPLGVGDVNCDNMVNVSDVVFLITYIFSDGPAPCSGCK